MCDQSALTPFGPHTHYMMMRVCASFAAATLDRLRLTDFYLETRNFFYLALPLPPHAQGILGNSYSRLHKHLGALYLGLSLVPLALFFESLLEPRPFTRTQLHFRYPLTLVPSGDMCAVHLPLSE